MLLFQIHSSPHCACFLCHTVLWFLVRGCNLSPWSPPPSSCPLLSSPVPSSPLLLSPSPRDSCCWSHTAASPPMEIGFWWESLGPGLWTCPQSDLLLFCPLGSWRTTAPHLLPVFVVTDQGFHYLTHSVHVARGLRVASGQTASLIELAGSFS